MDELQPWVDQVKADLGIEATVPLEAILDVARVAAHNVARPAAPVTTFLLGVAAAAGIDPSEAAARIERIAEGWEQTNTAT